MRHSPPPLKALLALCVASSALLAAAARADEPFVFMTNWFAEAEHGGYYQAQEMGLYKKAGLDVTIKMGGAQVNTMQLLAAGQADCIMGSSDVQVLKIREQGVPAVVVAAVFQKDPMGIVAHPDVKKLEDLKGHTIFISTGARNSYWPWLKAKYGLSEDQGRPYTFNLQPFIADPKSATQGFVTNDPYTVKQQAGYDPSFFLLSDYGWTAYANTVVCLEKTIKEKPRQIQAFLKASMQGYKSYLEGDASAANARIRAENPAMPEDILEYSVKAIRERGIVTGGDAVKGGIGVITPARLKLTYDYLVEQKLLDPSKVDLQSSFTAQFAQQDPVLP